eukprot:CAMPEP_0201143964 /NCGR_PEP_ID=MMETSP0851-20130426/5726_1 /ASSEMBLY_ACC=CAM_ASM_000631 /TAXON_ID=183588 /ORGANISM="Pseudo-nitzschia fraudulenta, Strain WWA7" /LENGTH=145 /DNA_ID=CAMNT_0047418489 /DNA_START=227 /DNA_END=662 /DNA_ORIENTATION=+
MRINRIDVVGRCPQLMPSVDAVSLLVIDPDRRFAAELLSSIAADAPVTSSVPLKEEGNLLKLKIRNRITLKVANDIEEGYIGAVVICDEDADGGYCLIKWTGAPCTDQDSGELVCPGDYLMPVGRAPKWYTPGEDSDVVLVKHVV